ncbi:general transcription factor II-I repeat domain-containing protein 2A-like [Labeo rohita]|uniref:general transcription factor II-I repeat domain-containing protein 2A-like n=1 Tax=Labeo rohita TaxID=84645 RepID=UPI0021E3012B|nr:general transcription factor II-I repeat domain-containing protein 2A-like [Labeo rohita]
MDKFVIRGEKRCEENANEGTHANKKSRCISNEGRRVLEEWKNQFAVNERDGQPFCLLCRKILGVCKTYNVKRHFDTTHATFDKKYPLGSQERAFQITSLEKNAIAEQNTMRASLKVSQAVTLATFKISWLLAKHGKPFSDGELVKNCFLETQCLFDDLSNKNEIIRRIKSLQLSNDTVTRRISEISENLTEQLKTKLTTASALSLAADESTDIGDVAQLCIWVRCVNSETFEGTEDLFALKSLHERTRGEDIHRALSAACKDMNIPASSVVSITTDGAPSMTGKHKGLVAEMRKISPDLLAFHCIVHQQALCSKLVDGYFVEVMDTVVKVVNFIRARPLMHRRFIALLDELDSAYGDLILHSEVRWLSRGKVLSRFLAVLPEIVHFLNDIGEGERFPVLRDNAWKTNVAFLADVTAHLNKLNLQLQGDGKHVDELLGCVESFKMKLGLYTAQLKDSDLTHFPLLNDACDGVLDMQQRERFVKTLSQMQEKFISRFSDFEKIKYAGHFIREPFTFPVEKNQGLGCNFRFASPRARR